MNTIAIVGGTGAQGQGLAYRFAKAGHTVILGSRSRDRARKAATELGLKVAGGVIRGDSNPTAIQSADVVLLAVPWQGHDELVGELASHLKGKVVISCVNPLGFDKGGPYGLDLGETSAAENAQRIAPEAHVVGAFHHLSAVTLMSDEEFLDHEDVLVVGDDDAAMAAVMDLAATVTGKRGIDAGRLRLARQLEPLTAVLISINKRYRTRSGLAVVGV